VSEKYKAQKAIDSLSGNRPVKLIKELPPLKEKNAKSAVENGAAMTDVLATWLKKGFVAGPFGSPPCKGFRSNPLMAAVQRFKVRPIMNLSSPKGASFNDAVDEHDINLLEMSSARLFGEAVKKAGKGAIFSKQDIQDAYKLIPVPKEQWHLYGFECLANTSLTLLQFLAAKRHPPVLTLCPKQS
jgi:hypothetical protein